MFHQNYNRGQKASKACNIQQVDLTKNAPAVCIILILNKSIHLLSYDDIIIHAILMISNYRIIRFSELTI